MKKNKSVKMTSILTVFCVVFLFVLTGCSQLRSDRQEAGIFEWNDGIVNDPSEALHLIEQLDVTRWYQEISDERDAITDEAIEAFVQKLHTNGIAVYFLIGSKDWGLEEDGTSLSLHLKELLDYNTRVAKDAQVDGVMLDIETYLTEEWKNDPETAMSIYVSCMKEAYETAKAYGVSVAICIPRDYDDTGLSEGLEQLIAETCDEVAVMNYGCGNEIEQIATEVELAERYDKEIHCVLEFQEVGKHGLTEDETYSNKGIYAAESVWDEMQKAYPSVTVIRDYHSGDALRNFK